MNDIINISNRLKCVASLVNKGARVADIGTDHAYLPIYLVQNGISNKVYACDVRKEPLRRAQLHIDEYGLSDKITTQLCDGLKGINKGDVDTVTICGMGGKLMKSILQAGIDKLIAQLLISGRNVEIETNGSIDINKVRENVKDNLTTAMNGQVINGIYDKVNDEMERLSMTADYKLAGSNMEQYMKLDNFNNLQSQDTVKFVVSSEEDLKRALEIIRQYNLTEKCYVYFSPVFGKIEPVTIVDFMKDNLINGARVQLQLHKFIWSPDKKGV